MLRAMQLLPCEIYQAWHAAFAEAEDAYAAWRDAPLERRGEAYLVYRAATDREDEAATHWLVER